MHYLWKVSAECGHAKGKINEECKRIWNNDLEKIDIAKKNGYNVKVIWQYDWETCKEKTEYIKSFLC